MKFTFDYEETLVRRVVIDGRNVAEALAKLHQMIDDAVLVLNADDFMEGKISMPLNKHDNFMLRLEHEGQEINNDSDDYDLVVDWW